MFVAWLGRRGIKDQKDITAGDVREWLAENAGRLKDTSLHARTRGVRTFLGFLHEEGTIPAPVQVQMPRLVHKRLPCLELEDLKRLLKGADARKAAIIRLLAFPGIRAAELCNLNWSDLDMQTEGAVRPERKGPEGPRDRGEP